MLRADLFAFAAFDTFISAFFAVSFDEPAFLMTRRRFVLVERQHVHRRERAGYADIVRADFGAVIAGRARNYVDFGKLGLCLLHHISLLRREVRKIFHVGKIVVHLLDITHTGKNNFQPMNANFGIIYGANRGDKSKVIDRSLKDIEAFKNYIND